jgi:hypothetical protein
MRSKSALAALRDIAHHIDLATSFAAGLGYDAFRGEKFAQNQGGRWQRLDGSPVM